MLEIVYEIDGSRVDSLQNFFDQVGESVSGAGTYFGQNLDAFADCLRGGFGTPEDRPYSFVLTSSDHARRALGYDATLDHLRESLLGAHSTGVPGLLARIDDAERQHGPTLFDELIEIFADVKIRIELV